MAARDDLLNVLTQIPLVGRERAEGFVEALEDTVGDAADDRIKVKVAAAVALGGLALIYAFTRCRCKGE